MLSSDQGDKMSRQAGVSPLLTGSGWVVQCRSVSKHSFIGSGEGFFRAIVEARFILITNRRRRGGDHFDKESRSEERGHNEHCCHHTIF